MDLGIKIFSSLAKECNLGYLKIYLFDLQKVH